MKNLLFKLTVLMLVCSVLLSAAPIRASAEDYPYSLEVTFDGIDCRTDGGNVFIYPNKTDKVRSIKADEYNFYPVKLFVFDKEGKLIEVGKNLLVNDETRSNAPQEYLNIPAGGFAVATTDKADNRFNNLFQNAMEGGVIYNASLSVLYDAKGSYDEATKKLKIEYSKKEGFTGKTKFLFVGNSSTYFNGTPLKFKGLAKAAGVDVYVTYCTYGAAKLSEYADETHERGKAFRNHLKTKHDYVILQDAGAATYETSKPAADILLPLIKESGAKAALYMRYSGEKVPENRKDSAKVHYDNYTKLGEDFDIPVAPVAEAFLICTEKYPDINLYADDKAHHSKEASYLAACVWLKTYLGIDPRGNTYNPELDESTVKALQECAYLACEVGYFDPKPLPVESTEESIGSAVSEDVTAPTGDEETSVWVYVSIIAAIIVAAAIVITVIIKKK